MDGSQEGPHETPEGGYEMSKNVRLYRFFNLDKNEHGAPFAECDDHINEYKRRRKPAAPQLILEKIADQAVWSCNKCSQAADRRAEQRRFAAAALTPGVTQKEPIWCVVLRNRRSAQDGVFLQSDAWSYRDDLSDIDQEFYEIIAKTRPVREEC